MVGRTTVVASENEQASLIALGTGFLGDEVRGELIIQKAAATIPCRGKRGQRKRGRDPFVRSTLRAVPAKGSRLLFLRQGSADHLNPFNHSSKPFLYWATESAGPTMRIKYGPFFVSRTTPIIR